MKRVYAAGVCALALTACAPPLPKPPPFQTTLAIREVMDHVIDPAAKAFWGSWGYVATREGVRALAPTSAEGWSVAENGAATVAEAGNLLMLPGRAPDDPQWRAYALGLSKAGLAALAAARSRDEQKIIAAGSALDEACDACHERYQPAGSLNRAPGG